MTPRKKAEEILFAIPGIEDAIPSIDRWLDILEKENQPLVDWANAMVHKASRLQKSPVGFIIAMVRDKAWADWLDGSYKITRRKAESESEKAWPYERGRQNCPQCLGAGWTALRREEMSDIEDEMKEAQESNGVPALRYGRHQDRVVFLCPDCAPAMKPAFEDQSFPAYPVGANAVPPSHDPDVSFEAYITHG